MKKITSIFIVAVLALLICTTFFACKGDNTFTGHGITITLPHEFSIGEFEGYNVCISSNEVFFVGNREKKSELAKNNVRALDVYTEKVLATNGQDAEYFHYVNDDLNYYYSYYTATRDGVTYLYMLVSMEGKDHYYVMNFVCDAENIQKYQELFGEWVATIKVE